MNKKIIFLNIFINFIIFPLIAWILWYLIFWLDNYYYIFTLLLLSIIPWWWLLVNWLHHSWADMKAWFTILALNLWLFAILFIPFNLWIDYFINSHSSKHIVNNIIPKTSILLNNNLWNIPWTNNLTKPSWCVIEQAWKKIWLWHFLPSCFSQKGTSTLIYWFYWFFILIFIPFILSRIILLFSNFSNNLKKYVNLISKIASFLIIIYIFSLNYIRWIININNILLVKIISSVFLLYILMFLIENVILKYVKFENNIKQAIFWNWFVRFITLWFILSFLYAIAWNKPEIVIIFIVAYFVQIWLSSIFIKIRK